MQADDNSVQLEKSIDLIAANLVMAATDDMPGLAKLHESFLSLANTGGDNSEIVISVARKCADLVESIILDTIDDKEFGLVTLNEVVGGIQAIIRDKRNPAEVTFPPDLAPGKSYSERDQSENRLSSKDLTVKPGADSDHEIAGLIEDSNIDVEAMILNVDGSDSSLLGEFITEAREHCATAEQMLMELETEFNAKSAIDAIFRSFHTIKGAAGFLELKPIGLLAHESETLLDLARKGTIVIKHNIADVVLESIDSMRTMLDGLEEILATGAEFNATDIVSSLIEKLRYLISQQNNLDELESFEADAPKRLGEVLVDMGAVSTAEVEEALSCKGSAETKVGEALVCQGKVSPKAVIHALRDQKRTRSGKAVKEIVKIDTERLDRLVDTIGELVVAESMVGQDEEILALPSNKISRNISHLNKITRELQEMGMAMRLVPVRATFQKLTRAVRDLARKSGKKVDLKLAGEDSEVDRSIVESIGDPLMHMVRNSIDHGLETVEERIKAEKPEVGNVWIRAYHKGGNIYLEIEDDGRGLDKKKILARAREKGLISSNKELSDKQIYNLITLPGFSTAEKVTDISGRGVGMDVVRKNIDAMRGHLEIESEYGWGTKFSMRLPLTLANIDGMLVSVGNVQYIIPTLSVEKSLKLTPDMISTLSGRHEMINLHGSIIPLFRIRDLFDMPLSKDENADSTVVIVDDMERRVGLVVDQLLGQRQIVIKSMGATFRKQKWISGGAILPNGNVGLIIDTGGIIELAGMCREEIDRLVAQSSGNGDSIENEQLVEKTAGTPATVPSY
jgi:two-component system chemotaxis sensor kinase CheA